MFQCPGEEIPPEDAQAIGTRSHLWCHLGLRFTGMTHGDGPWGCAQPYTAQHQTQRLVIGKMMIGMIDTCWFDIGPHHNIIITIINEQWWWLVNAIFFDGHIIFDVGPHQDISMILQLAGEIHWTIGYLIGLSGKHHPPKNRSEVGKSGATNRLRQFQVRSHAANKSICDKKFLTRSEIWIHRFYTIDSMLVFWGMHLPVSKLVALTQRRRHEAHWNAAFAWTASSASGETGAIGSCLEGNCCHNKIMVKYG